MNLLVDCSTWVNVLCHWALWRVGGRGLFWFESWTSELWFLSYCVCHIFTGEFSGVSGPLFRWLTVRSSPQPKKKKVLQEYENQQCSVIFFWPSLIPWIAEKRLTVLWFVCSFHYIFLLCETSKSLSTIKQRKYCSHTPLSTKLKRQHFIKHAQSKQYCCSQLVVLAFFECSCCAKRKNKEFSTL